MNILIENNYIKEQECGSNFSYVLTDNNLFLSTEYKVLQSQANGCFVKCMKMMYNGQVQLYYVTKGLKSFASMIPTMDPERFVTIVSNLFADILDVQHNGFLSCRNVDIAFERIYVDPATLKAKLVYLPLSKRLFDDNSSFENEIRTGLVKLISMVSTLFSAKTMQLSADLSNGTLSMGDLYERIILPADPADFAKTPVLRMVMDGPSGVEFVVNSGEFVIGKKAESCDGVLDSSYKMISRVHCKITKEGSQYMITDLKSANGTFVNKNRLQPEKPVPVHNGDVIRLANCDFRVTIG